MPILTVEPLVGKDGKELYPSKTKNFEVLKIVAQIKGPKNNKSKSVPFRAIEPPEGFWDCWYYMQRRSDQRLADGFAIINGVIVLVAEVGYGRSHYV